MSNISHRAMLVQPSISLWTARRFDRKASEEVAANHNAESERAGRYNKCVINVKAPSYVALTRVAAEARRYHEAHTLPWAQDGARILSSTMFFEYQAAMKLYQEQFDHAARAFLVAYPGLKEAAEKELNGLYKEEDYPTASQLAGKFAFSISVFPIPLGTDFRVEEGLTEEDVAGIREQIEDQTRGALKQAEQERWARLLDVVSRAVERLSTQDAIFRDSLIGNIRDAVAVLPKLALAKDENFDSVIEDVRAKLCVCDPDVLRDDPNARANAARRAAEIVQKMSAFMK